MSDINSKCSKCGLINFAGGEVCRRCGSFLRPSSYSNKSSGGGRRQSSKLSLFFALLLVVGIGATIYFYNQQNISNQALAPQSQTRDKSTGIPTSVDEARKRIADAREREQQQRTGNVKEKISDKLNQELKAKEDALKEVNEAIEKGNSKQQ